MYNLILFVFLCNGIYSSNFYTTFQVNSIGGGVSDRKECRSVTETFKKGTRCCYSSQNNGVIDTCSPRDGSNQCISDNSGYNQASTYQYFQNYSEAVDICASLGRRLCTIAEYDTLCPGSGCGVDALEGWTTAPCTPVFKTYNTQQLPKTTAQNGETDLAAVRCCTLVDNGASAFCETDLNGVCWYNEPFFNDTDGLSVSNQELISYTDASIFCESIGRRLCDYDILTKGLNTAGTTDDGNSMLGCLGTGCQTNYYYTWSRTSDTSAVFSDEPTSSPTSGTPNPTAVTEEPSSLTHVPTSRSDSPTMVSNAPTTLTNAPTGVTQVPTSITNAPTALTDVPTSLTTAPTVTTSTPIDTPITLYCTNANQCTGTNIADIIYAQGLSAADGATLIADYVNCTGSDSSFDWSCQGTTVESDELYCNGRQVCRDLDATTGSIDCSSNGGTHTCAYSRIETSTDGFIGNFESSWSLQFSRFYFNDNSGTALLNLNGYEAAHGTRVYSGEDNTLNINLRGRGALGTGRLLCGDNSQCNYYCDASNSCDGIIFVCSGATYDGVSYGGTCTEVFSPL